MQRVFENNRLPICHRYVATGEKKCGTQVGHPRTHVTAHAGPVLAEFLNPELQPCWFQSLLHQFSKHLAAAFVTRKGLRPERGNW